MFNRRFSMIISKADQKHIDKIAELHTNSWRNTYRGMLSDDYLDGPVLEDRKKCWHQRITDAPANQLILVAEDQEQQKLIGFICVYLHKDKQWGTLIDNLHVSLAEKGKGVGSLLLHEAAKWIVLEAPDTSIYLWAYEKNKAARHFYENLHGKMVEGRLEPSADGKQVMSMRYWWDKAATLLAAIDKKKIKVEYMVEFKEGTKLEFT